MNINGALSVAGGGLAAINAQLALVSQNVANASTPGYTVESATLTDVTSGGVGMGVHLGPALRASDQSLQGALLLQNAAAAGLAARQSALAGIDAVQGTPGQGNDLGSLLGKLQDGFSALAGTPDDATQQNAVVGQAQTLANGINALSGAYTGARQTAQEAIVADVGTVNATLATIGTLSDQIVALKANGQSTADLESQRAAAVQTLSALVDVKVLNQPNGDVLLTTGNGLLLPTRGQADPLSTSDATLGPSAYAPGGGVPAITLDGTDVTSSLTGGRIGANITLRDTTLPGYQGQLDEFAQTLASRFDAQGLRLFTDPTGAVPSGSGTPLQAGYIGFAGTIQVNPAVSANPALVRDGTQAVAGSPTGAAAFTPNPPGGPAGFTGLVTRVLDFALGADVQTGVAQPAPNTSGLGPAGTLAAPYAAPSTLAGFATALSGAEAQDSAAASSAATGAQDLQTTLQTRLTAETGVSIDAEMSLMVQLQNAYGANAKVIAAVQSMWTQLLNAVP